MTPMPTPRSPVARRRARTANRPLKNVECGAGNAGFPEGGAGESPAPQLPLRAARVAAALAAWVGMVAAAPPPPVTSPHGVPEACGSCHAFDAGQPAPIDPRRLDALCLGCHDGASAPAERHPIGRTFDNPQVAGPPPGWPLVEGRLSCLTCHDIVTACRDPRPPPVANPAFVRGFDPRRPAAFCGTCHAESFQRRTNPHDALDAAGRPREHRCLFCHLPPAPSEAALTRSGDPRLHGKELSLCGACHTAHVEYFEPGHLGAALTEPMLANLVRLERRIAPTAAGEPSAETSLTMPSRSDLPSDLPHEGRIIPKLLPLADGRITCSTCHNPHPAGLFPEESVLALGAMRMPPPSDNMGLRIEAGRLCIACHNK